MPSFDGTGPKGSGPLTGGRRGYCAVAMPGPETDRPVGGLASMVGRPRLGMRLGGRGLGLGRGRRGGRGRGRRW